MSIVFKNNIFSLETKDTLYQIKVDEYGVLLHLWYGGSSGEELDYLLDYPDIGFSGNIYEARHRRNYSYDTLPLEYSALGTGDYRVPAFVAKDASGTPSVNLKYKDHIIYRGKYSIPGMPAVYSENEAVDTLEITLEDTKGLLEVVLKYGVFEKENIITRSAAVKNLCNDEITLDRVMSLCMDIKRDDLELIHFHGRHFMERRPERIPLVHAIVDISSNRGTSSHQHNPGFIICDKDCTEDDGFCMGALLVYSGSFLAQIELDQMSQARAVLGISPENFSWRLAPDEIFYSPEVILSSSEKGLAALSQSFHEIIRHNVCRGKYKLSERPVLINSWETAYFDFDDRKILRLAKDASDLGLEMLVLDDGWFGKRDDDTSGLGDWYVNTDKLKGGLAPLIKGVKDRGLKFGIWIEPEMVSEDSNLYLAHPEWVIHVPGRAPVHSRYQMVLDFSNKDVVDHIFDKIKTLLTEHDIDYVKWDMNRSICDWSDMEHPHKYVLGVYDLAERLTSAFPDILFEGCSGGGGRFDAGMLYYFPQIWCSDNSDAYDRTFIQYGTSFFYPISTMGAHVSEVPNHRSGRVTSLKTRAIVAMSGCFGYELDLGKLSPEEKQAISDQVKDYSNKRGLIHDGTYYRLSDPYHQNMSAWMFVSKDKKRALVYGVHFRSGVSTIRRKIRLRGLDAESEYLVKPYDLNLSGSTLCNVGLLLPEFCGDEDSFEFEIIARDAR